MRQRRNAKEIEELLENFRTSGLTQIAYSQQVGIALSTLGRYLRRGSGRQQLVRVNVEEPLPGFVLVLNNGRRIESGWNFGERGITLLIRVAEAV